jgi:uncharacterized protein (DUF2384 family)
MGKEEVFEGLIERRQTLTPADVEVLRKVMREMVAPHVCTLGIEPKEVWIMRQHLEKELTPDQVSRIRRAINIFDRASSIIGYLLLAAFVGWIIVIFSKGFWQALFEGMTKAR